MITWRNRMSVDGGVIDRDHQHLIEIINRFEKLAGDGLALEEGMEILYSLKFYASTHFKREEGMQLRANYPYYESHKREHADLMDQLETIIKDLQSADETQLDRVAADTSELLQHWLMDHVLKTDLKMKAFVDAMRRAGENLEELRSVEA